MEHLQVITSGDGSSTIFNKELNETYHSHYGAITESLHVFVNNGLKMVTEEECKISLLEIGLGTGLNALLTLQYCLGATCEIHYHALEPYPLDQHVIDLLNYEQQLRDTRINNCLKLIHEAPWEMGVLINSGFWLHKYNIPLQGFRSKTLFDLVYFDAFAPNKQADIWMLNNFKLLYNLMKSGGVLVSYCASGQFRRNLLEAGFTYEIIPGPPGKKEMTRAMKPS